MVVDFRYSANHALRSHAHWHDAVMVALCLYSSGREEFTGDDDTGGGEAQHRTDSCSGFRLELLKIAIRTNGRGCLRSNRVCMSILRMCMYQILVSQ